MIENLNSNALMKFEVFYVNTSITYIQGTNVETDFLLWYPAIWQPTKNGLQPYKFVCMYDSLLQKLLLLFN